MTAREIAKALIRPYVLRGGSLQSLSDGQMGRSCADYRATIGGYLWEDGGDEREPLRKLTGKQIAVKPAGDAWEWFSLPELYDEIRREIIGEPVQATLL